MQSFGDQSTNPDNFHSSGVLSLLAKAAVGSDALRHCDSIDRAGASFADKHADSREQHRLQAARLQVARWFRLLPTLFPAVSIPFLHLPPSNPAPILFEPPSSLPLRLSATPPSRPLAPSYFLAPWLHSPTLPPFSTLTLKSIPPRCHPTPRPPPSFAPPSPIPPHTLPLAPRLVPSLPRLLARHSPPPPPRSWASGKGGERGGGEGGGGRGTDGGGGGRKGR